MSGHKGDSKSRRSLWLRLCDRTQTSGFLCNSLDGDFSPRKISAILKIMILLQEALAGWMLQLGCCFSFLSGSF